MGCCASGTKTVKVEPWPSFQDSFGNQESADHQQKSFKSPVIAKEVDKHHKGTDTSEDGIVTGRYDVNARDPKDRGRGIETTPLKPSDTATLVKECEQKSIKTVQTIVVRETKSTSSVDVNINAQPDRTPAPSPEDKHNQESKATNHVETKKSNVSDLEVEDLEVEDVEVKHRLPSDIIVVTVEKVRSSSTCDGAVDKLTDTKDVSGYGNRPDEARKHAAESKPSENAEIDQHMDLIIADIMSSTIDATLPEVPDLQLSALKTEEQKHTIHDIETKQCDDGSKRVSEDATSVGGIPVSSASRQAGEALSENPVNSTVNSNSEILTEYHESETVAKSSTDKAGEFSAGGPSIQRSSLQSKSQLDTTSEKSTAHIVTTLEAQQVSNIALEQIKSAAECKNSTVPSNSEILTEDNKRATVAKSSTDEAGEFSAGGPSIQTGSLQSKCLLGTASAKSTADMVASFEAQQVSNIAVEQIKSAAECGNSHDAKQYSCDNEIDKINEVDDVIGRKIAASGNSVAEKNTENLRDPTENVSLLSHEADATVTHLTQNLSSSAMGKTQGNDTALDTTMAIGKTGQTEETTDKDCESMTIEQSYECSAPGHPQESTAADTEKRHDNNLNVTGYEPDEVIQDSGQAMETNETIRIPESVEVMTEQHDTSRIGEMMSDSNQADHDRDKIRIETLTNENRGADFVTANEEYLKTDVTIRSDGIIKCNDEGPVLQGERAVTPVVPATTPSEIRATGQALDTQLSMNSKLFTNEDSGCPPDRDELPRGIENSTSPSEVICTQDTHEVADSRNSDRNEAAETFPTLHSPTEENGEHSIKKTNSLEVGENLESKILTASSNPETENVASAQDTLAASSATSVKGLENMPADDTLADAVPCSQSDNMICENSEDITITEHNINYKILQSIPAGEEQKPKSSNCDSHVDNNAPVETAATDQANCAGTSGSNLSNDPCSASSLVGQNSFEDHQSGVVDHAEEANDKAEDASTSAATPCACSSSSPPLQHSDKNIPLILHLSDTIHEETTTNGEDNDASATVSKVFTAPDACSTQSLPMETLKQRSAPVDNQVIHENSTINENPKDVSITVSKVSSVTSDACSASSLPIPENEYPLPWKSQSTLTGIGQLDKIAEEHHGGSSVAVIIQCSQSVTPIQTEPKHSPLSGVSTQQNNVPHSVTSSGSCEKQEHSNAGINAREDATIPQKPECDLTDEDKKVKSHDLTSPKSP
ncbi:uncharacterized protein [Diadema setosum]|uniref:uncharacterized protein n=1 Tax=Diadema setosum TaxID=31175 RepID=UPI003B3A6C21